MLKAFILLLTSAIVFDSALAGESVQDTRGAKILAAGDIEPYSCPGLGLYDCTGWPSNLYRFTGQDTCFTTRESCAFGCAALLIDMGGQQSLLLAGMRYREKMVRVAGQAQACPQNFAR
ncbi:hypothetical protein ABE525_17385 [Pseudomonas wadenswilerensis]|uniref:hypothetical protein n=1 Tax=Pseudomonas wadenswilerensis TaxID=1785161 RepID=UPI000E0FC9C2|nr:hypothetical protein [Pseudomonas wadenswilerensis]